MTFTDIVNQVAEDLNLTSTDAINRIGRHVNRQYNRLLALPWLQISRRGTVSQPTTVGVRYLMFPVTKLYSVFDPNRDNQTLGERTFDEMRNMIVRSDPPNEYAIARADASSVTLFLDCTPATVYSLTADAELRVITLSGNQVPGFNEDFHDILIYGAKELELLKMEKADLAAEARGDWDQRLSDLKFHIAKTSYLDYLQGKDRQDAPAFVNTIIQ